MPSKGNLADSWQMLDESPTKSSETGGEKKDKEDDAVVVKKEDGEPVSRARANTGSRAQVLKVIEEKRVLTPQNSFSGPMEMDSQAPQRERAESSAAPPLPRISFTEVPEELALLDLDALQLPPMNPTAKPLMQYSLHFLLTSTQALPPEPHLRPSQTDDGRIQLSPMRDRGRYEPLAAGTPSRFNALLELRDSQQGGFTAGFVARTGLNIPEECDPDVQSRRESNLSASDWEYDDAEDYSRPVQSRLPVLDETELASALDTVAKKRPQTYPGQGQASPLRPPSPPPPASSSSSDPPDAPPSRRVPPSDQDLEEDYVVPTLTASVMAHGPPPPPPSSSSSSSLAQPPPPSSSPSSSVPPPGSPHKGGDNTPMAPLLLAGGLGVAVLWLAWRHFRGRP